MKTYDKINRSVIQLFGGSNNPAIHLWNSLIVIKRLIIKLSWVYLET